MLRTVIFDKPQKEIEVQNAEEFKRDIENAGNVKVINNKY